MATSDDQRLGASPSAIATRKHRSTITIAPRIPLAEQVRFMGF